MQTQYGTAKSSFMHILGILDILFLPVDGELCERIGLTLEQLRRMKFEIKLVNEQLVITGALPNEPATTDSPPDQGGKL